MAHPTRGHRSGTYEIEALLNVDLDKLEITYRSAAAFQPQVLRLQTQKSHAARQMLQAMADSIKVGLNGDADSGWESAVTLQNGFFEARVMLEQFHGMGLTDFSYADLSIPVLRSLYEPLNSNRKRSACWLLARVVRDNHPNGKALSVALRNTRFGVEETNPYRYDDEVAEAIEHVAREVYRERFDAQRDLLHRLGHDTSSRSWLRIPAADIIAWAHRAHPDVAAPEARQPSQAAAYETQVAWALTHPERFGHRKHQRGSQVLGPTMKAIGQALYPDNVTIAAAAILHCLGENAGFNFSVLLEKNADTLSYIGPDDALEHNVKARNHSQDTRPTRLTSIYTPGGVVESLTGLTRFSRHARAHLANPDGRRATIADRLYVEHTCNPEDAAVIDSMRMQNAWRANTDWDDHWNTASAGSRAQVPLRMAALRLVAQRRAMADGLAADVHGHSERTRTHYSAHVLPDYLFNKHAVAAQDSFHDTAIEAFKLVADATDGPAATLAAVDPETIMDVEIGLCTSNGNAPDGSGRRCGLGIVACFTCPNGYRTVDHVPGLLAAVELGNIIELNDPDEWENGQASALRFFAQACIDEFPPMVVANIRRTTDLVPHIITVTGMYMELRDA